MKTGWIWTLSAEVKGTSDPYMTFTISDAKTRPVNIETFVLNRGGVSGKAVDLTSSTDYLPVSYSNATMALISLMKDAYWNEARIRVTGSTPTGAKGTAKSRLEKVEFMERYGPVVETDLDDGGVVPRPVINPDLPIEKN